MEEGGQMVEEEQVVEHELVLYNKLSCPAGCMAMRGTLLQATVASVM